MTGAAPASRVGVVIPAHRHPALVEEAILSALTQDGAPPPAVVVVDDGCPFTETRTVLRAWATAGVTVIRRPNGGLSAARNTGVRHLLRTRPDLEAIFLLDSDNLLEPTAMAHFARLLDTAPEADWFFPAMDMFGLDEHWSTGGAYSLLRHAEHNMCEAGSLVRRRVFDAGVRFDETMRSGYEDWDFWLSAGARGFRGAPMGAPVFRYRRRAESMLSGSHRDDAELRGYLRRKHRWLYSAPTLAALEHEEAPRFRLLADDGSALAFTDPLAAPHRRDAGAFAAEVWRWLAAPDRRDAGAIWLAASDDVWSVLRDAGALRYALWDLERRLQGAKAACLIVDAPANGDDREATLRIAEQSDAAGIGRPHQRAGLFAITADLAAEVLRDRSDDWLMQFGAPEPPTPVSARRLSLSGASARPAGLAGFRFLRAIGALRESPLRDALAEDGEWRAAWLPRRSEASTIARRAARGAPLYPAIPGAAKRLCVTVRIAEFGGVEMVVGGVARALRDRGFETSLCLLGSRRIVLPPGYEDAFAEVLWFDHPGADGWGGGVYEGTNLPSRIEGDAERALIGLLSGFDAVIAHHGAVSMFGPLRRAGVTTVAYEHLLEHGEYGRSYGTPLMALANEAATDLIAVCSEGLAGWLRGHGAPADKIVVVPNAAGYPMSEAERQAALARRFDGADGRRPLRALYLGRLDKQKGIDRLAQVIEATRRMDLPVAWRVVGKSVVDSAGIDVEETVVVEPPVWREADRTALYAWADVVVMPSRYEGLPLTIIEAQRCGAVPIAADAGAVSEAIAHDRDGVVVSQDGCVEEMVAAIARLAGDRGALAAMAQAAAEGARGWDGATADLAARLEAVIAAARSRRGLDASGPLARARRPDAA